MPAGRKCVFNPQWLTENDYRKWLHNAKGERHNAFYKICNRKFSLASIGVAAFKSHKNSSRNQTLSKIRAELNLLLLIELGTCGPHTAHGAFQTGAKATNWDLDNYLNKEYKLFKDSPARREDYVPHNGVDMFPSKFCNHRWLENLTVANKSITLLPYIKEYCNQAALNKTEPKEHAGYQSVTKAINDDKLLKAKHLFWMSLAQDFQPFLKMYQIEKPMVPFLASDVQNLLRSVMNRFIEENVLSSANSFTQVEKFDVSLDKNKKTCKELDIGTVTRKELNHLKQRQVISSEVKKHFEFNAKAFLSSIAGKLLEKCPLKSPMVRFLRSLDPRVIGGSTIISVKLFERLLSRLSDAKRILEGDVDSIKREYSLFVQEVHDNPKVFEGFQSYSVCEDRADSFLASHLESNKHQKLWNLVKCLLVLSHGQAGVERGFSLNKEAMQYHFKERSVVAL